MQTENFVTETWFMALLISMISVMVVLFAAMFFVRRRQLLSKKAMTPSRSNGGVLSTPLASKQEAPLWLDKEIPDYAATYPEYSKLTPNQDYAQRSDYSNGGIPQSNGNLLNGNINLRSNPMHFKEQYATRPDKLEYGSENGYPIGRKYNDYNLLQVQEYASPNVGNDRGSQIADYAEVDASVVNNNSGGASSPAPYATTTLVTGSRRLVSEYFYFLSTVFERKIVADDKLYEPQQLNIRLLHIVADDAQNYNSRVIIKKMKIFYVENLDLIQVTYLSFSKI